MKHLIGLLFAFLIVSCEFDVEVNTGRHGYDGAGVRFEIPMENSSADTGPSYIRYKGERFSARTYGSTLWVNDVSFGEVNPGDVISFYEWPLVRVNE